MARGTLPFVPVLEQRGVFSMSVPDGWTARFVDDDGTYELTPSDGAPIAAHLSVYDRSGPVEDDEARMLVGEFLASIGVSGELAVVASSRSGAHRTHARAVVPGDAGAATQWVVAALVWAKHAILFTINGEVSDDLTLFREADEMFTTLEPVTRRWPFAR
jgi:hypothetical protein